MEKTKNKRITALVVMALMLIASIALAATGAWFTDSLTLEEKTLTFGNIDISQSGYGVKSTNTIDATNANLFPGSALTFSGTITNAADPAYVACQVTLTFAQDVGLTNLPDGWTYTSSTKKAVFEGKVKALAKNATMDLATELTGVTIPTSLTSGQTTNLTISASVFAIQQANVSGVTAGTTTYSQLLAKNV